MSLTWSQRFNSKLLNDSIDLSIMCNVPVHWAVLGSRGCREKNLPTAISVQLFGVVFSSFRCQENILKFKKNKKHFNKKLHNIQLSNMIGDLENLSFFWMDILDLFFKKKKKKRMLYSSENQPKFMHGRMDGSRFWCFPWFTENYMLCVI